MTGITGSLWLYFVSPSGGKYLINHGCAPELHKSIVMVTRQWCFWAFFLRNLWDLGVFLCFNEESYKHR